jgi:hypothetical protein
LDLSAEHPPVWWDGPDIEAQSALTDDEYVAIFAMVDDQITL